MRDAGEQPSMSRYPGLPSQPWYDAAAIPAAVALERAAPQIIAEFGQLDPSAFVPEAEPIARSGSWDVFLLYERGRRHDERCRLFPTVTAILEQQRTNSHARGPRLLLAVSTAFARRPASGPTNMRVRAHLGIEIPPECGIRVGEVSTTWHTGTCIVFDDSFPHDVWNESDRERIVLVVDLVAPRPQRR